MSYRMFLDRYGGVLRWASVAPGEDEYTVVDTQNVDTLLRANARDADVDQSGRHFRLAARIPWPIVQQAQREGWIHDSNRWKQFLNDPDNRAFRVWPGKV